MTVESSIEALSNRYPYAWLRERDVDLLVCAELHANGQLRRLLAERIQVPKAEFTGAWVSHAEIEGESDLVAAFMLEGRLIFALIENKIAAAFQPDQGARYLARAKKWSSDERVSRVVTVLFAPSHYRSKPEAENFEVSITYEEAANALRLDADPRAIFLADALQAGVEALRRGYVMEPDAAVTDMWQYCWQMSLRVAPKLNFQEPGLKPGRSTWFYFREADGFSQLDRKRAVVVYKAERGQVDLQFASISATALSSISVGLLDQTMKVVTAAKSASIRISVPPLDFTTLAAEQEAVIIEGFGACERLRALFVQHHDHFASTQDEKNK